MLFMRPSQHLGFWGLSILLLASCASKATQDTAPPKTSPYVLLAGQRIGVETARTDLERRRGLGGRVALAPGQGMLFLYDEPAQRYFWMKDMRFAIDIVWILGDRVVGIHHDVRPEPDGRIDDDLRHYNSPEPVDRVLETPAGFCRQLGVSKGDRLQYCLSEP
jgi:uncharacterized membrane protein (UPF0127 family)